MNNDFIEYWAAAALFVRGDNPYSPDQLLVVQRAHGWLQDAPLLMWNPPWTLTFTAALGLLDFGTSQFLWVMLHSGIILIGSRVLWRIYDGAPENSRFALAAVLTFAPAYLVLFMGQIGALILLGMIIFLRSVKKEAWITAGLALSLVSIKPHLAYLFWFAVCAWVWRGRRWRFFSGWVIGAVVTGALPLVVNPDIYFQYLGLLNSPDVVRPFQYETPSLGLVLGRLVASEDVWLRWVPSALGAAWLFFYWRIKAATWEWSEHLPLILLVSVSTASFVWSFDQIVLLPAVIQCGASLLRSSNATARHSIIATYVAVNAGVLLLKYGHPADFWYFWIAPLYLMLFLSGRRMLRVCEVRMDKAGMPEE